MPHPKYLIVKGKAGLGNRMLCALTGLLYARMTRRRLIVDWGDFTYSSDGSNSFPKLFECPEAEATAALPETDSVAPALWKGRLTRTATDLVEEFDPAAHNSANGFRRFSVDLRVLEQPEDVLVMWSFTHQLRELRRHFCGAFAHFACMRDNAILAGLLREAMRPRPEIQQRVEDWWAANLKGRRTIGVHLRLSDRRSSISAFHRAIERLMNRAPHATLFVATDNQEAQNSLCRRFGHVVVTPKWFPPPGIPMHQNPTCPDRLTNAVEAMLDMYLLARCDYLVYPRSSTFSYVSSLLSHAQPQNLIDTERYNVAVRAKRLVRSLIA